MECGPLHFPALLCFNTVLDLAINCFGNQLFEKLIYCLFCVYCSSQNEIQNWILLHVQFSPLVKNRERETESASPCCVWMIQRGYILYIIFDYLSVLMQSPYAPKNTHYGIGWRHFMYIMPPKQLRDQN